MDNYIFSETDFNKDNESVCILKTNETFLHSHIKRIKNIGQLDAKIGFNLKNKDFYILSDKNQEVKAESAGSNWGNVLIGYIPTYLISVYCC